MLYRVPRRRTRRRESVGWQLGHVERSTLGAVRGHNIVITSLSPSLFSRSALATLVSETLRTFPGIRLCFSLGIGGGVPSPSHNIRQGDVVVVSSHARHGDMIQLEISRDFGYRLVETPLELPKILGKAVSKLQSRHQYEEPAFWDLSGCITDRQTCFSTTWGRLGSSLRLSLSPRAYRLRLLLWRFKPDNSTKGSTCIWRTCHPLWMDCVNKSGHEGQCVERRMRHISTIEPSCRSIHSQPCSASPNSAVKRRRNSSHTFGCLGLDFRVVARVD